MSSLKPNFINDIELKGISGWLGLLAFILSVNTSGLLFSVISNTAYLFSDTFLAKLTQVNAGMKLILVFQILFCFILFVFSIYSLYLFFKKRTNCPKNLILFLIAYGLFSVFNYYAYTKIGYKVTYITSNSMTPSIIWIFYIVKSKRVKNTFVN